MLYGEARFKEILEKYKSRPVLLYGDPDTDGLVSLLLMCKFCDMLDIPYSYYVNENRYHGFTIDLDKLKGYLVIAADFAITEEEVKALVNNDVVLLSTDHHDIQPQFIDIVGDTAEGIVINNQYPFEPEDNRYQSGAGVFYELASSLYPEFKSKENEALVGVTLLSDMRPIENPKARKYLKTTYTVNTEEDNYFHYLISSCLNNDFGFGVPKFDRNFIDFNLNPTINALLRADKTQEAIAFILGSGLTSYDARGLQKSLLVDMHARASIYPFNNITYLMVNASDFFDYPVKVTSYIGLFCNDYSDKHGKSSVLGFVVENGKVVRASFRGKYDDIHYRSGFRQLGLHAEGHPGAFGVQDFEPVTDTWYDIDDLVGDLEANHEETVKIVESTNLAFILNREGMNIAIENSYCRDMYRTYIKYTGSNAKVMKQSS